MKLLLSLFILSILTTSCSNNQDPNGYVKYDSAHTVLLDGQIKRGTIITSSKDSSTILKKIKYQLYYTIGLFNEVDSVADLNQTKIKIISIKKKNSDSYQITYSARMKISWPLEREVPDSYLLTLPKNVSNRSVTKFFERYGNEEALNNCLDYHAHDVTEGIFWYYYRPYFPKCPLKKPSRKDKEYIYQFDIYLSVSNENTENKYPEYEKVWEDGRLVVTSVFGKVEMDGKEDDAGVIAYNEMYKSLLKTFGKPTYNNIDIGNSTKPGTKNPRIILEFETINGPLEVHLFLVEDIKYVDYEFIREFNSLTLSSDFIAYSGHSGLGANIRAMARMGKYREGQYQIFLINGCDTFAYVDNSLKAAHKEVNPRFGGHKYFDLITNGMPSYFIYNTKSNMAVINALAEKKKNYRELLADFSYTQRANVTGEEDNSWPLPFEE